MDEVGEAWKMRSGGGSLRVAVHNGCPPLVKLTGEADFHNRHRIERAFGRLIAAGHTLVQADLGGLDYLDSSAVSALIISATRAGEVGGAIELTAVAPPVSRVLNLCGAAAFFVSRTEEVPVSRERDSRLPSENYWHVSDFSFAAAPESAALARARVSSVIRTLPLALADSEDVMIAVGEAIANAIKHGCSCDPDRRVTVKCVAGPGRLAIDIMDDGGGFNPEEVGKAPVGMPLQGGMGIYMMRRLMDEVTFSFSDTTVTRLVKYIPGAEEEGIATS